jgi:hypothetical protein
LLLESSSPEIPIESNSILSNAIFGHARVTDVCVGGQWKLTEGIAVSEHVSDVDGKFTSEKVLIVF